MAENDDRKNRLLNYALLLVLYETTAPIRVFSWAAEGVNACSLEGGSLVCFP